MATKTKPDNQNLARSRSLGIKPKPAVASTESDRKTNEKKPLPNYLKPTISSRPYPVKLLKKNNEDNQKTPLIRKRSFDRPSPKPLNVSPKPSVAREKGLTALRSTSFQGSSRSGLRVAESQPLVAKKSGMSGGNGSFKSKKEGSENVSKKSSESSPVAAAHENEEENVKVETVEQVEDKIVPIDASIEGELIIEDKEEEPKEQVDEEESSETIVTPTTKAQVEVVQGKRESPTAYNDVIASKMQESSTKRKVLALAGAFQTVIDCETAASK